MRSDLQNEGFAMIRHALDPAEIRKLVTLLGPVSSAGRRGLLEVPAAAELARSPRMLGLVRPHFKTTAFPARAIYFDKSPGSNWLVPWHRI